LAIFFLIVPAKALSVPSAKTIAGVENDFYFVTLVFD
jgi:hypothetical protein